MISQLDAKIYACLSTRLATMSGGYYIAEPGETYKPGADETFLITDDVRFDPNRQYRNTDAPDWHTGVFMVSIVTPLSWTHSQRMGVAGLIRAHMPKDLALVSDDVTVKISETPFVAGSAYRDPGLNMMRLPVSIRWRAWG